MRQFLQHTILWFLRFRNRKGYGVHSPFAFQFITQIIYETDRYYAYDDLDGRHLTPLHSSYWKRRIHRLFLRLANYQQPRQTLLLSDLEDPWPAAYLLAGCQTTTFTHLKTKQATDKNIPEGNIDMLVAMADPKQMESVESLLPKASSKAMFVLEDIHRDKNTTDAWQSLKSDARVCLTFDLYDIGILLFNPKLNKQDYIINF